MFKDEPFICLRNDGVVVWKSPTGKEWDSVELFKAVLKQNLPPQDEKAVLDVIDKSRRLQRHRPMLYPFA